MRSGTYLLWWWTYHGDSDEQLVGLSGSSSILATVLVSSSLWFVVSVRYYKE